MQPGGAWQAHPTEAALRLCRPGAYHLPGDHGAASPEAPPDLRQQSKCRRGAAGGGQVEERHHQADSAGSCPAFQWRWPHQPHHLLAEPLAQQDPAQR